ncbi:UNVERIFIED_CONTAM: hypothetical protein K2H54_010777 [Gekko kuhli]
MLRARNFRRHQQFSELTSGAVHIRFGSVNVGCDFLPPCSRALRIQDQWFVQEGGGQPVVRAQQRPATIPCEDRHVGLQQKSRVRIQSHLKGKQAFQGISFGESKAPLSGFVSDQRQL